MNISCDWSPQWRYTAREIHCVHTDRRDWKREMLTNNSRASTSPSILRFSKATARRSLMQILLISSAPPSPDQIRWEINCVENVMHLQNIPDYFTKLHFRIFLRFANAPGCFLPHPPSLNKPGGGSGIK